MLTSKQKLALVQLIFEQKDLLMAPFSPMITRKKKLLAWDDIRNNLLAIGADPEAIPNSKILRDKIWPNIKRLSLEKTSSQGKTGGAGGKLTEIDEFVINIVGRDSAQILPVRNENFPINISPSSNIGSSLKMEPTLGDNCNSSMQTNVAECEVIIQVLEETEDTKMNLGDKITQSSSGSFMKNQNKGSKKSWSVNDQMEEMVDLRIAKIKLECINLELQNKKLKLEIQQLELQNTVIDGKFPLIFENVEM